jgi:hypothetical protein
MLLHNILGFRVEHAIKVYLLKPETKITLGIHESIIERRHGGQMHSTWKRTTDKKQICLFGRARSFQV